MHAQPYVPNLTDSALYGINQANTAAAANFAAYNQAGPPPQVAGATYQSGVGYAAAAANQLMACPVCGGLTAHAHGEFQFLPPGGATAAAQPQASHDQTR